MAKQDFYTRRVYARKLPVLGKFYYYLLKLLRSEIPLSVPAETGFFLEHGSHDVVEHSLTMIGDRVHIYQGVTLGWADIYLPSTQSRFEGIEIGDDVILSPGCKVLCKQGILKVGAGTVVDANAVLLRSTGENEIWAGDPARCVIERPLFGSKS